MPFGLFGSAMSTFNEGLLSLQVVSLVLEGQTLYLRG